MALLNSIPDLEGVKDSLEAIPGNPPSLLNPPSGCAFRPRCSLAVDECAASDPPIVLVGEAHASRCHRTAEIGMGVEAMS
jgi:oligopeptide/dipeptide ABC transporter ATP-binding protein